MFFIWIFIKIILFDNLFFDNNMLQSYMDKINYRSAMYNPPETIDQLLLYSGAASIIPFLTTVSRQRGYSSVIVGFIFTIIPIPGLFLKPVIGVIADKYKCHKSITILVEVAKSVIVCVLLFIPGKTVDTELKDTDVIKSPLFWLYSSSLVLLKTGSFMRTVMDDTMCVSILGNICNY